MSPDAGRTPFMPYFCLFRKLGGSGDRGPGDRAGARAVFERQAAEFNMRPLLSPLVLDRPSCPSRPARVDGLNGLPALNVGVAEAAMFRLSPVLGLRPVRAGRLLVPKVPEPTTRTSSPLARASPIASNTASTALPAADLPTPIRSATRLAISDLFTRSLPALPRTPNARFARKTIAEAGAHG